MSSSVLRAAGLLAAVLVATPEVAHATPSGSRRTVRAPRRAARSIWTRPRSRAVASELRWRMPVRIERQQQWFGLRFRDTNQLLSADSISVPAGPLTVGFLTEGTRTRLSLPRPEGSRTIEVEPSGDRFVLRLEQELDLGPFIELTDSPPNFVPLYMAGQAVSAAVPKLSDGGPPLVLGDLTLSRRGRTLSIQRELLRASGAEIDVALDLLLFRELADLEAISEPPGTVGPLAPPEARPLPGRLQSRHERLLRRLVTHDQRPIQVRVDPTGSLSLLGGSGARAERDGLVYEDRLGRAVAQVSDGGNRVRLRVQGSDKKLGIAREVEVKRLPEGYLLTMLSDAAPLRGSPEERARYLAEIPFIPHEQRAALAEAFERVHEPEPGKRVPSLPGTGELGRAEVIDSPTQSGFAIVYRALVPRAQLARRLNRVIAEQLFWLGNGSPY